MPEGLLEAVRNPTIKLESNKYTEPFKSDSCNIALICIFLDFGLFLGAANLTSNNHTIIAGDSIRAKAPTINPSKAIF